MRLNLTHLRTIERYRVRRTNCEHLFTKMNLAQKRQFIRYFRNRRASLDYCNATFENTVRDQMQTIMNRVNNGRIQSDDPELSAAFTRLNWGSSRVKPFLLPYGLTASRLLLSGKPGTAGLLKNLRLPQSLRSFRSKVRVAPGKNGKV